MSARVHALLVVRPDDRTPAAHRLKHLLSALAAQTRPVDELTIIHCGDDADTAAFASESAAGAVLAAPRQTTFAQALRVARPRLDALMEGDSVWLLAQDTVPAPDALAQLTDALELAPSMAVAAPKLVRFDDQNRIVSLGVTMTRFGRAVGLADGEFDQGQHDATEDVLGADVRGLLVRARAWRTLAGLDAGLAGADEGLDLGVRARLSGSRVRVVSGARVAVYGDGVAGLPGLPASNSAHNVYARRRAQLQRRLAYARAWAIVPAWLSILPTALWRTAVQLVGKTPGRILPEWGAAAVAAVRVDLAAGARARIRGARSVSWRQLDPLRITRAQLRTSLQPDLAPETEIGRGRPAGELRFFSGGGAWAVLAALLASVALFPSLLVWPSLGGGALAPLRATVTRLWADAGYGLRPTGLSAVAPADPFSAVVAVLGSLWPYDPSRALVLLWLFALPLAVLGGWFASTRLTDRSVLRITGGVLWGLAPTFLVALSLGRPAAVMVHLLLPWLLYTATVAHRSWGAAAAASLLLAAVVACAPVLAPALGVLWAALAVGMLVARRGGEAARVVWVMVPTLVLAAPLVWRQVRSGSLWGLLADPGMPWAGPQSGADAAGRALLAAGSPTADPGGWAQAVGGGMLGSWAADIPPLWALALLSPVAVAAVAALFTRRWLAAAILLMVAVLGLGTALAAAGISVQSATGTAVPLWPGTALSLFWAGVIAAALVALDCGFTGQDARANDGHRTAGPVRTWTACALMLTLAVFSLPALTAHLRGQAAVAEGSGSTLPAFVEAAGRSDPDVGTIVLEPLRGGAVAAQVVWGESQTLGGQSTVLATRTTAEASDLQVAALAADLVIPASSDVVQRLQDAGISFVLLRRAAEDADLSQALHSTAALALDQREGLDAVGETGSGTLWRVTEAVTPRAPAAPAVQARAHIIALVQLLVVAAALLLAVPTAAGRRRARSTPRVVGRREVVRAMDGEES